jgi:ABC-type branched-subunit amino acid transport system ATPase component
MTSHASSIGDSEALVDAIESNRELLRARALAAVGVAGDEQAPALIAEVRRCGVGWYPLVALMSLILIDAFQTSALLTLAPDIARSFGVGAASIAALYGLQALAMSLATIPMSGFVQRKPRRAALAITTALTWSVATSATAFVAGMPALALLVIVVGAASGSVRAVHLPLLFDFYPPGTRARIYSLYLVALWGSFIVAPGLVALFTYSGLTWRGVFLALGAVSLVVSAAALRLRDPGFGRWDTDRIRDVVADSDEIAETVDTSETAVPTSAEPAAVADGTADLRVLETLRRLLIIPTIKRLIAGFVVLGILLTPLSTFTNFYLDEQWHQGPAARGLFGALTNLVALPFLVLAGRRVERWYRKDPVLVARGSSAALGLGIVLVGTAVLLPVFALMAVTYAFGIALFAASTAALGVVLGSIVPAGARVHVASLANIALYGAGGLLGQLLLGGVYDAAGPTVAIVSLTIPGALAGIVLYTAGRSVNHDLDAMVDEIVDREEVRELVTRGVHLPMLSCRRIDAGYDNLQVLFDVSFAVDEGEMVALLGTNGAGKSTLMKVMSGLVLPSRGTVRLQGNEITYFDPQRRVRLGIQHVAGGNGTFSDLTVVENLRTFGYLAGRRRRSIESGIDEAFATFPRLAERRNQKVLTMSGGEKQMLALSRALVMPPRLLMIDELSLGLAPKVVGELLALVKRINAGGAAVVLIEQSVNVALGAVEHAYFMEKGEVQFDGAADDLAARDDLLRAVFLAGAKQVAVS